MKNPFPWRIALTVYLVSLALIGFWPAPVDKPIFGTISTVLQSLHGVGVPNWFDYHFVEASANIAMFIPLGFLTTMALPTKAWWHLAAIGLLASICMEGAQLLLITARYSSVADIVTNTCGAVTGIVMARLLARMGALKLAEA